VNQCHALIKPLLTSDNIQYINELDADSEILVIADQTQLKQVIINLLSNAIKYNNSNGSITIYAEPSSNNKLRLCIKDTGIGIKTELQHRLFEPFDRLDNEFISTGTGIGLSVTKRLLDLMNGDIGFTSAPGNGSVFWIEIDRA
jgi:signal transduction histidine kinase